MKRKILLALMVIALSIIALGTMGVSAVNVNGGSYGTNITWTLDDKGTLTLSGSGSMQKETSSVPYPWKTYKSPVKSIVIKPGITSIAEDAFYDFYNLNSVTIPNTVVTIDDYAFGYCELLKNVTFDEGVTTIGRSVFIGCKSLKNITIPNSVTDMGSHTFYNCSSLENVTLSKNLKNIGSYTFYKCEKLTSIEIPESVTSYDGWQTFSGCTSLQEVTLSFGWYSGGSKETYILGGVLGASKSNNDSEELYHFVEQSYGNITGTYSIPKTLKKVIIKGNHNIPENAFQNCIGICEFVVDENNSYYKAIDGDLYTKDGTKLCQYALGKRDSKYIMPDNVVEIGDYAFKGSKNIENIMLSDSLTTIGLHVFSGCNSLVSITIPDSVTNIKHRAFFDCNSLSDVYYDGTEEKWSEISIDSYNTSLTNATIHYNCKILNCITYVITDYEDVKITDCDTGISGDISIPSTIEGYPVTTVDYNAFKDCDKITSVVFPESVTDIFGSAFENCTALSSITFTDNVTWLGGSVFGNCTSLTSVTLPANLSFVGDRAFYGCTNLKSIEIDENNSEFSSIDGNLFNKQATTMLQYSIGKSESAYIIPDGVTMIDTYCFEDCVNLSSITIPESIQEIRMTAFRDCPNIKNVYYYGTQDEWNKVLIGTYNDGLTGATIHFIKPRTETVLSNNDKTFTITPINIATGNTVILALYNGTALVEMQSLVYNGEPIPFTTTKDYANAKVFVWENFETLVPICEAEIVK